MTTQLQDHANETFAILAFAAMAAHTFDAAMRLAGEKTARLFDEKTVEAAREHTVGKIKSWGGL